MPVDSKEVSSWGKIIAIGAGLYIAWKYAVSPALEAVGLKDSASETSVKKQDVKPANINFWDPNFKKQYIPGATGVFLLTTAYGPKAAADIYNSKGSYYPLPKFDDYEKAAGVIRGIKYRSQISDLADIFSRTYKQDLYSYLKSWMSSAELATINELVKLKPSGFTKNGVDIKIAV